MSQNRRALLRSKGQDYPVLENINPHHPLVMLAALIDWPVIERSLSEPVASKSGWPRIRPRLIAELLYL